VSGVSEKQAWIAESSDTGCASATITLAPPLEMRASRKRKQPDSVVLSEEFNVQSRRVKMPKYNFDSRTHKKILRLKVDHRSPEKFQVAKEDLVSLETKEPLYSIQVTLNTWSPLQGTIVVVKIFKRNQSCHFPGVQMHHFIGTI